MFNQLNALPADPLLGIIERFAKDSNPQKIDLGVGIYKNEEGHTPVLVSVKTAEANLLQQQDSKAYIGPRGDALFTQLMCELALGEDHRVLQEGQGGHGTGQHGRAAVAWWGWARCRRGARATGRHASRSTNGAGPTNLDPGRQGAAHECGPIVVCAAGDVGLVLNHWLLGPMFPDSFAEDGVGGLYWLMILVLIESPLATAPITLYLGQAMFVEKPSLRQVAARLPGMPAAVAAVAVAAAREVLIVPLITWIVPYGMWPI